MTKRGATLETGLGGYYRLWLTKEGLLTGQDANDAKLVFFHANTLPRTIDTAQALAAGILPGATIKVDALPHDKTDPLFDPVTAGVAQFDQALGIAAVKGRLGNNPQSLAAAYGPEYALTRQVLFGYPASQNPPPATPAGKTDVTAVPIAVSAGAPGMAVNLGGFTYILGITDPFLFQYAEGFPMSDVGWGQLNLAGITELERIITGFIDLEERTPYLARVQSSNLASHIVRSIGQAASGKPVAGALGDPSTKLIALVASDFDVAGFAGLFKLDWLLPGYEQNYCAPGGALVLELRQSASTRGYYVRASYIAQTLDQLRNGTQLSLDTPPAIAPIFIPGCSSNNATFDCRLEDFQRVAGEVIDPAAVAKE